MAFPDLAATLLYAGLCLVPEVISLQTVRVAADLDVELSEFEKSTWSLIGSGISLSLLYFLYVGWRTLATGRFRLVHSLDIGWVDLVAVYPLLLVVAVLVGYAGSVVLARVPVTPLVDATRGGDREAEKPLDDESATPDRADR